MAEHTTSLPGTDDLGSLCVLGDGTRRSLYEYVAGAGEPVDRDEVSAATGIDRSLVAYHLDKLVDEGLLTASFARRGDRRGPGAGRPAKFYRRAEREFAVTVPPRDYRLVAEVLARAAEDDSTGTVRRYSEASARRMGHELADEIAPAQILECLQSQGFEPYDDAGVIRLRNCPFHQLAREHTDLVCGMNLAMLTGLVEETGAALSPRLDPGPGRCCVALERA